MKELYIHIGTHKTGTTAIQKFLFDNKVKLIQKNKLCVLNNHQKLFDLMNIKSENKEIVDELALHYNNEINSYKKFNIEKFIISFEGLSGSYSNGYKNTQAIANTLKLIVSQLKDISKVKIIVFIRRQDDFVESIYTQQVKEGSTLTFKEFISEFTQDNFDWYKFIKAYEYNFEKENTIVKLYDKKYLANTSSILSELCSILSIEDNNEKTIGNVNPGLNRDAIEVKRIMNKYLQDNEKLHLRNILEMTNSKSALEKFSLFETEKQRKLFFDQYRESNDLVAKEYNSSEKLFSEIHNNYKYEENYELDIEKILVVIMNIILKQNFELKSNSKALTEVINYLQTKHTT